MGGAIDGAGPVARVPWSSDILAPAIVALATFAVLAFTPSIFNDGDTSWHLAAGRLILGQGSIPGSDPFSYTFAGKPWVAHEWLAEVVMAGVFGLASWSGLALLFAAAIAGLILLLGLELRRHLSPRHAAIVLILILVALAPFMLVRPHVLAWLLLAAWTIILLRARDAGRAPPLAAALFMLVWANLHGSFIFGLLLIGPFALEALIAAKDRRSVVQNWGLFGLTSLLLSLVNPHGYQALLFPLQVSAMKSLPLIEEWRATIPAEDLGFEMLVLTGLAACLFKGVKVPLIRLLLFVAVLYLAFQHMRHQAVFVIVGSLLLAKPLGLAFRNEASAAAGYRFGGLFAGAMFFSVMGIAAARLAIPMAPHESASNPVRAMQHIPPELKGMPVFNSYGFGGPLILRGVRPFIDGRADMYGDAWMVDHHRIRAGNVAAFARVQKKMGAALDHPGTRCPACSRTRPAAGLAQNICGQMGGDPRHGALTIIKAGFFS